MLLPSLSTPLLIISFLCLAFTTAFPTIDPHAYLVRFCSGPLIDNTTLAAADCFALAASLTSPPATNHSLSFYSPTHHFSPSRWPAQSHYWRHRALDAVPVPATFALRRCRIIVDYPPNRVSAVPSRVSRGRLRAQAEALARSCVGKSRRPRGQAVLDSATRLGMSVVIVADHGDPTFQHYMTSVVEHWEDVEYRKRVMEAAREYYNYEGIGPYEYP